MAGTAPPPSDVPRSPSDAPAADGDPADPRRAVARRRWWVVVALVVALVAVLLWQPWQAPDPDPAPPLGTPSASTSDVPTTSPEPTSTPTPSVVPPPGADAVFDAATAGTLFLTAADVEGAVPGATTVTRGVEPGSRPWGLPAGSSVEPASCTAAVTVVSTPPTFHDATSWVGDELMIEQDVVLLLDAAAARAAFRALVTTVDECPRYAQVVEGVDGARWTADPALEGQGVFPAIVHDVTAQVEGDTFEQTTGHVLIGNAILTWTATALTADGREDATAVLGEPADLSAMVERRALAAVRGLP